MQLGHQKSSCLRIAKQVLTFWKVEGGWPTKMAHLQQSITGCNIVVIIITPRKI
jgi:hypothetical protein